MKAKDIIAALQVFVEQGDLNYTYDRGWNQGVTAGANNEKIYDDGVYTVDGYYTNLDDEDYYGAGMRDYYEGWNEGKEAALAMKNGEKPVIEKTPEEIQYERRMKCFTMAEKYAPNAAIRGGEREPVGETINRAEILYGYFYSGALPGSAAVKEK